MQEYRPCSHCGTSLQAGQRFCSECGRGVDSAPANEARARGGGPQVGTPTTLLSGAPAPPTPPLHAAAPGPGQIAPAPYLPAPWLPAPGYPPGAQPMQMVPSPQPMQLAPGPQPMPLYPTNPQPMQVMPHYPQPLAGQQSQVFAPTIVQQIHVVQQQAPAPIQHTTVVVANAGPGILVRALYFFFIGWWFGFVWISLAWALNATIIGLPLGLLMLNRVPQIMTLSPGSPRTTVQTHYRDAYGRATSAGNATSVNVVVTGQQQYSLLVRALYFIFIGWWVSLLWTYLAYGLALTIIGLPISFMMFNVIGLVTTLHRN